MGSEIILSNNVTTNAFPTVTSVPAGMPGNLDSYGIPRPPEGFAG
jgi:hypothetical protein